MKIQVTVMFAITRNNGMVRITWQLVLILRQKLQCWQVDIFKARVN